MKRLRQVVIASCLLGLAYGCNRGAGPWSRATEGTAPCPSTRFGIEGSPGWKLGDGLLKETIDKLRNREAGRTFGGVLEGPADLAPRRRLAEIHENLGFPMSAQFFQVTASFLEKGAMTIPPMVPRQWWVCPQGVDDDPCRSQIARVQQRLQQGWPTDYRPLQALPVLETDCVDSCEALLTWANVTLRYGAFSNSEIAGVDLEAATRVTLEFCEDDPLAPSAPWMGASGCYYEVAVFFHLRGDPVSSYVAAKFAEQRARTCPKYSPGDYDSLARLLRPMLTEDARAAQRAIRGVRAK